MMQEMMRNDPNVPPMMRQQMEAIANNPAMIDQIARQMRNPATRAQMESMMAARGAGGAGMPGYVPSAPSTGSSGSSSQRPQGTDQDQTEEEMIAEAIRRSLEES